MAELASLVESGNIWVILIVAVLLFVTGAGGASYVQGRFAAKRGVASDAIAKEQNGINALGRVADSQEKTIIRLDEKLKEMELKVDQLESRMDDLMDHINKQDALLVENGISPLPRP